MNKKLISFLCGLISVAAVLFPLQIHAQFQESKIADVPVAAKILPRALHARFMGIAVNDDGLALAVGERGIILRSTDKGASWQQVPSPVDITLASVFFEGKQRAWAVGQAASILRSDDGGKKWKLVRYKPSDLRYYLKVVVHDGVVFVTASDGELWTSRDNGATWEMTQLENGDAVPHLFSIAFQGQAAMLSAEHSSVFLRSQPEATWQILPIAYNGSFFGVTAFVDQFLLFGMSGRAFLVSADGKNQQALETGTTQFLLDAALVPEKNQAVLVGRGGAVVIVAADGKVLSSYQRSDERDITAISIKGDSVLIATMRGGIERLSLAEVLTPPAANASHNK